MRAADDGEREEAHAGYADRLCASKRIGPEDVLVVQPDWDVGGRRAKLRAYELAPAEWQAVLYLDADTEVVAPIYAFFEWVEDGWELVICRDLMDTMHFPAQNNRTRVAEIEATVGTLHTLQINGGVWAFGRNEAVKGSWTIGGSGSGTRSGTRAPDPGDLRGAAQDTGAGQRVEKVSQVHAGCRTRRVCRTYPGEARRWEGKLPGAD